VDQQSNIYVITGNVQSGKTTYLSELVKAFQERGIHVAGFLCRGQLMEGKRSGYTLVNILDGSEILFATRNKHKGWQNYGRFFFNPEAFAEGEQILLKAMAIKSKIVIIDEVGPLELEDKGWATMLGQLQKEKELIQIWTVRENLLERVLEKWNIPGDRVFHVGQEEKEETLNKIYCACQK